MRPTSAAAPRRGAGGDRDFLPPLADRMGRPLGSGPMLIRGVPLPALAGEARVKVEQAARLWGTDEALREAAALPIWPDMQPIYDRAVAAARAQCDEATFAAAWAAGRAMPLDQAIAYALEDAPPPEKSAATPIVSLRSDHHP